MDWRRDPGRVVAPDRDPLVKPGSHDGGNVEIVGLSLAPAMASPDLKGLYTRIYLGVRWPVPLPRPDEVGFRWNHRFEKTSGICYQKGKIIEVKVIYRDPRLRPELEYLMIHEAAHFIWRDHSPAFRA